MAKQRLLFKDLEKEVSEEHNKKAAEFCKNLIRLCNEEERQRKAWIDAREHQNAQLAKLKRTAQRLFDRNRLDAEAVDVLTREYQQITNQTVRRKHTMSADMERIYDLAAD